VGKAAGLKHKTGAAGERKKRKRCDSQVNNSNGDYKSFLERKTQVGAEHGFEPTFMPDLLFPFQKALVEWATRKGRSAIFADCGLGKTLIQLTWAENVARKTGKPVLILAPLAVAFQTVLEGQKIGLDVLHRREGRKVGDSLIITNYERLHYFDSADYSGVVCDESSILKNFDGATRQAVTDFMRKTPYRLLCTATAAPNDYMELGTSSEALGEMKYREMLARFFNHDGGETSRWRLKRHAALHIFWRWICSWARAMRKPSDFGFEDDGFILPSLTMREHIVMARRKPEGMLFDLAAINLQEQREELRRTLPERCEMAAQLANAHNRPAVTWCHLNDEGDMLEKLIRGSVNVEGGDAEEFKEETFRAFATGQVRVIVSKPTIAGFGLNWQHCAHETFFPSHSYEQFYQATRRCWRFGQTRAVVVDIISTEGQAGVLANMKRKTEAADKMFERLVALMMDELKIERTNIYTKKEEAPSWL